MNYPILTIQEIAPQMNALRMNPDADVIYDVFSGALVWNDEFPRSLTCTLVIRSLFVYRTSLIIGDEKVQGRDFWNSAKEAFPLWPGFSEGRCSPNKSLAAFFMERTQEFDKALDELENDGCP